MKVYDIQYSSFLWIKQGFRPVTIYLTDPNPFGNLNWKFINTASYNSSSTVIGKYVVKTKDQGKF